MLMNLVSPTYTRSISFIVKNKKLLPADTLAVGNNIQTHRGNRYIGHWRSQGGNVPQ